MRIKLLEEYSRGELALMVLKGFAAGGFIIALCVLPGLAQVVALFNPKDSRERYVVKRTILGLEKRGYIARGNQGNFRLTKNGIRRLKKQEIYSMKIKPSAVWDRWWRIVIFDIPNTKKATRVKINENLKNMGFIPIQKSTFLIPYECKKEVAILGEHYSARKYLKYIKAKEVDGEAAFKKHFNLS